MQVHRIIFLYTTSLLFNVSHIMSQSDNRTSSRFAQLNPLDKYYQWTRLDFQQAASHSYLSHSLTEHNRPSLNLNGSFSGSSRFSIAVRISIHDQVVFVLPSMYREGIVKAGTAIFSSGYRTIRNCDIMSCLSLSLLCRYR